ncbi:MAG: rhodanese-like domain-containing protein [Melioribacteraceae bacterium]
MGIINSLFPKNEENFDIDSKKFEQMIDADESVILDVRTSEEFSAERIPNAILIDIYQSDFASRIDKLDRAKKYLVYCRSGHRSHTACKLMIQMGFNEVYNLKDGIIRWNGKVVKG